MLVGAGIAGGVFFMLNRPQETGISIIVPSPMPSVSIEPNGPDVTPERQLININLASTELLVALPGIGEVKAQAIVDYRNQEGPFHRTDELMKVPGIGPVTYEGVKDLVTVGEVP